MVYTLFLTKNATLQYYNSILVLQSYRNIDICGSRNLSHKFSHNAIFREIPHSRMVFESFRKFWHCDCWVRSFNNLQGRKWRGGGQGGQNRVRNQRWLCAALHTIYVFALLLAPQFLEVTNNPAGNASSTMCTHCCEIQSSPGCTYTRRSKILMHSLLH